MRDPNFLRGVWLPAYQTELAALIEVQRLSDAASRRYFKSYSELDGGRRNALLTAWCIVRRTLEETVRGIVDRGGLLMIINPTEKGEP